MKSPMELLEEFKIVTIIRGVTGTAADRTVEALAAGGIKLVEVTMNTEGALDAIGRWRQSYDGELSIGAGTVLDLEMAKQAVAAGARYLISPNLDTEVIHYGLEQGVEVWPGVMTPTEIVAAWKAGAKAVKVFPTGTLGLKYIQDIRAPLSHIPMIATGGVHIDNIEEFLHAGVVGVGMGSHIVQKPAIESGRFEDITRIAQAFTSKVAAFNKSQG